MDLASVLAAPATFLWARQADLLTSGSDAEALRSHLRSPAGALDEFPFPGRLFEEVVERLYRQDGFARGRLTVGGQRAASWRCTRPPNRRS